MEPAKYASELERLATELALKTRQIREAKASGRDEAGRGSRSAIVAAGGAAAARRCSPRVGRNRRPQLQDSRSQGNTPYDGRFVFVRLRYDTGFGGGLRPARRAVVARLPGRRGALQQDPRRDDVPARPRPTARTSSRSTIRSCSTTRSPTWRSPGFWALTRHAGGQLPAVPAEGRVRDLRRLPRLRLEQPAGPDAPRAAEAHWIQLDGKSPVFHSFFEIDHPETLKIPSIYDQSLVPSYWGLFEDNDPRSG